MIQSINQQLFMVIKAPRTEFPYCHSLYIEDEVRALIDCSMYEEDVAELIKKRPDIILNTHFHEDHILKNPQFKQLCHSQVAAHVLDAPAIASQKQFLDAYGFAELGMVEVGEKFIAELGLTFSSVDTTFTEGTVFDFGKTQLTAVHLPGHSQGHCGFYYEPDGLLWGGDIELSRFGPWYGHKVSDLDAFIHSIDRCIEINPRIFISSHRGIITENIVQQLNDFKNEIFRKEEAVYQSVVERSGTLTEIAARGLYYGAHIEREPFVIFQERYAVLHLLEHLVQQGRIGRTAEIYHTK